jgi:hypothetical protein
MHHESAARDFTSGRDCKRPGKSRGKILEVSYHAVKAAHRVTQRRDLLINEDVLERRRPKHEVTGGGNGRGAD